MYHILARQNTGFDPSTSFYLYEDADFHSKKMAEAFNMLGPMPFHTKADAMLAMAGLDLDSDAFTFTIEEVPCTA